MPPKPSRTIARLSRRPQRSIVVSWQACSISAPVYKRDSLPAENQNDASMKSKSPRKRLDTLLIERGLAESLAKAQAMILAGEVRIDGQPGHKAGDSIPANSRLEIVSRNLKYASRAGLKLEGALHDFALDPTGTICLDIGSSTGGFTDCLLQSGATQVFAVDVNTDQLTWKLQQDPRVIQVKKNARDLKPTDIPNQQSIDLAVADVSFISATKILQPAAALLKPGANFLILVKPQFELPRADITKGAIVTDSTLHEKAIAKVRAAAENFQLAVLSVRPSRLSGAEGNQEYFLHARKNPLE
jgi:23S rRNA (cytidine1920-2'-O)/16S rRNA (cytidine1409-2'-O)-methyltransferase